MSETAVSETYNYRVVRQFAVMTVVWGIVGMLVGVILAAQLVWPALNTPWEWFHFGRLRPLHTNAVIFAFGGSALFASSYYVVQRTCQVRLISDWMAGFTFWGWNLVIVLAAVSLPLPADFNVRNALAAAAIAWGLGMPLKRIAARLSAAPSVPGRMEVLSREPVLVIRDFAHNPDSCERALASLREIVPGRVIALLGCGGDRDPGKRPQMGSILARMADVAIVTSDNPRSEDPSEICRQMVVGLPPDSYEIVVDRRAAIARGLAEAGPADAVALLGKGHETVQIIDGERRPFDERRIVEDLLPGLLGASGLRGGTA